MAFGSIAYTSIMFIAVVLLTTGLIQVLNQNIHQATSSATVQQQFYSQQMKTHITIEHAYYEDDVVNIYVKNLGNSALNPNLFSVFVGNNHFRVNSTTGTIINDDINTNILDKHELLHIEVEVELLSGMQYPLRVTTQYDAAAIGTLTT